ncbi:UDP-N-acetylglucosamine 1-carboxyvinyltransferase [Kyrpidia tusciae]|uniref:UDP-N-acetylglucosamine 1-carboxyvinyltransferase n=1 Tax=Kyrpidia tusciae (strain DSM 2912 / NBRC 15312 / T2) TaxID=562970 RepID=D5WX43_KYRT2|nr:UDP-N-acetylglucosamine 1-carboxyvinyltransferase [Kyrpidia tusciae]ADG07824.1 UDP-N-acetylglucosamine1-carboxyvinyltransferase [Kyrpidia tusciae DSM 2912]
MATILVQGGRPLKGTVRVSGAKNASLPILAASLLAVEGRCVVEDVPILRDVDCMCDMIQALGVDVQREPGGVVRLNAEEVSHTEAPYELVRRMRASFVVMGPLLARFGHARVALPGGCAIGARPVDQHIKGFEALGADVTVEHGYVEARAPRGRLRGNRVYLDIPSVGATQNIMMAAALADGLTIIENAAKEPEIVDLANFINKMGGRVRGAGTDVIRVEGVDRLRGVEHTVIPDRIEAGTFLLAGAITGGEIYVEGAISTHLKPLLAKLKETGVHVEDDVNGIFVAGGPGQRALDIKTHYYPGFPTDMQAQIMALLTIIPGSSMVTETVFENRFMHVAELQRMGADIRVEGRTAVIEGVPKLTGARVNSTDLRAGAALLLAGLAAEGETEVHGVHHIDRGYVDIVGKLHALGAAIKRVE